MTTIERLSNNLLKMDSGCWEFIGARDSKGYGRIWHEGNTIMAHRACWIVTNGPIPVGIFVLHKCDNPPCCNPDHLRLGTADDNTQDMLAKGRYKITRNPKLSADQVIEIKAALETGTTRRELSERFAVSLGAIDHIKHNRNWGHL